MYVVSVITSVTGSGTTARSMLTTAGNADRFAPDLVRRGEPDFLRFVSRAVMSSPRWLTKRDSPFRRLPKAFPTQGETVIVTPLTTRSIVI